MTGAAGFPRPTPGSAVICRPPSSCRRSPPRRVTSPGSFLPWGDQTVTRFRHVSIHDATAPATPPSTRQLPRGARLQSLSRARLATL
ncbi:hypothetical protein chiPu_0003082 [Chiloscyllium punctatum]|uniref:Uncharacterized protein n=1 Tax=Chiloscyllium punctatum TaxID=137246 RepID=A0A401S2Q8_CHIPU|nr:hypothetical protein [Chiloscyllium punctatum]